MHTKPSNAADEQYEVIAAITGIDSSTAVNSPTDSQVTFGAPESCDESRTIGLRTPRTDKKSRSSKQTNKRSRDGAEKGEVIAGDSDSDVPTTKRKKRQSKTVGRERMVFQFEQYGQPTTTTKAPKKKNQPVKTKQLKSSSFEGPGTPDTVKNHPRGISATPETQHIMVQHRVFPEAVRAQFGQLGDDKDDEEALPVAKESGA